MNIIAFLNQKGGVGKTTSAVNIGAILAMEYGRKVLLVDLDPQGNLSDHLGVYPQDGEKTIYDALIAGAPAKEVLRTAHGMGVLPANVDLAAAEVELAGMLSRETRLKKAIGELCRDYDYVLVDCPPSLGLLTICGLTLAQSVIVPMEAEYLALKGLAQLTDTIRLVAENLNEGLSLGGVLFCMYSGNSTLARNVKRDVEEYFPGKVFETCVRRNVRLAEAPSHEAPINVYDPLCAGADDYRLVTEEIVSRYEGEAAKKKIAPPAPDAAPAASEAPVNSQAPVANQSPEPPRPASKPGKGKNPPAAPAKTGKAPKGKNKPEPSAAAPAPQGQAAPGAAQTGKAAKAAKAAAKTANAKPAKEPAKGKGAAGSPHGDAPAAAAPRPAKGEAPHPPKGQEAPAPKAAKKKAAGSAAVPAVIEPRASTGSVTVIGAHCLYRRHAAAPRKPFTDLPPIWKGDEEAEL